MFLLTSTQNSSLGDILSLLPAHFRLPSPQILVPGETMTVWVFALALVNCVTSCLTSLCQLVPSTPKWVRSVESPQFRPPSFLETHNFKIVSLHHPSDQETLKPLLSYAFFLALTLGFTLLDHSWLLCHALPMMQVSTGSTHLPCMLWAALKQAAVSGPLLQLCDSFVYDMILNLLSSIIPHDSGSSFSICTWLSATFCSTRPPNSCSWHAGVHVHTPSLSTMDCYNKPYLIQSQKLADQISKFL